MHPMQNDIPWVNWAIAGTAQTGTVYANDASDRLIELIDQYQICSETPFNWYRPESERTWFGHTTNLCGSHALDWYSDRASGCENLTRLLQTIAASMMPFEHTGCRHEIGDCSVRLAKTSAGRVCQHSLQIELIHPFSTIGRHRRWLNECLEQLERRLLLSGIPQIKSTGEREAA